MKTRIFFLRPPVLACFLLLPSAVLRAQEDAPNPLRDPAWTPGLVEDEALPPSLLSDAPWAAEPFAQGPSEHRLEKLRDKALLVHPGLLENGPDGREKRLGKFDGEVEPGDGKPVHQRQWISPSFQKALRDLQPGEYFPEDAELDSGSRGDGNPGAARESGSPSTRDNKDETPEKSPDNAKTPSQIYLEGHLAMKEGRDFEDAGDFAAAFKSYSQARECFDAAQRRDPEWQKEIVTFRRASIRKDLQRVAQKSGQASLEEESIPEKHADPEIQGDQPRPHDRRPPFKAPQPFQPPRHEPRQSLDPFAPDFPPADESREALLQQLNHLENALQESRQREASLRAVLRDLLNDPSARQPKPRRHPGNPPANPGPRPPQFPTPPPPPRFFSPGEPVPLPAPLPPSPPDAPPAPQPPIPDHDSRP